MAGSVGRKLLGVAQLIAAVAVAGVLVAAVLLPFTGGLGLVARNSVQAFDDQPCDVEAGHAGAGLGRCSPAGGGHDRQVLLAEPADRPDQARSRR